MQQGYWASKKRIWEIDFLRGISIILMMIDHLIFDIVFFFREDWIKTTNNTDFIEDLLYSLQGFTESQTRLYFHFIFVGIFLILSGISNEFSKNNIIRGVKILAIAFSITIVTLFLKVPIKFGILHLIGTCVLIDGLTRKIVKDDKLLFTLRILFVVLLIVLDLATRNIKVDNDKFLFIFSYNFIKPMTESYDYAPLFQYGPMFFIGTMFSIVYKDRKTAIECLDVKAIRGINYVGKQSIWFYILHQPVIIVLLELISIAFITNGKFVKL